MIDLPRLLREMIMQAIEREPDMCVVGEMERPDGIGAAVGDSDPDFAIVGLEHDDLPRACSEFLDRRAHVRLLGIEAVDGQAYLYELRPDRVQIGTGSVTPTEVVKAIRVAIKGGADGD
jgi:DNA-binding NarL/FixJ family response regulator